MNRQTIIVALALLCTSLLMASASACRIPVFRYALERWAPGTFELVILHAGELTAEQTELVQSVTARANDSDHPINVRVTVIDLSSDAMTPEEQVLLRATGIDADDVVSPQALLLFPHMRGETTVAWHRELSAENLDRLWDSPARQQTIEKLLSGDSAVWVLIEGPNVEANDAAAELLEAEFARVTELIKLPPQEVLQAEEEFQADTAVELRIGFSLVRLKQDDPQEAAFREILLNTEPDLSTFEEPIAIPIFGRGGTYYALVGKGIKANLIEENCRFICGDCSCQVKEENPGSDLLFAANWEDGIRGSAFPEQVLPELTGIGSLDVIDLAGYERQVAAAETASATLPEDVASAPTASVGDGDNMANASEGLPPGSPAEVVAFPTADDPSLDVSKVANEVSPLWVSLLPVIGLALIVAVAGMLLLRS